MMQRFGKFKIRGNNGEFEVPASTSARLIDHFRLIFFPVLSDVSFFFFSINVRLSSCVFSPGSSSSGPDSLLYALLRALTRIIREDWIPFFRYLLSLFLFSRKAHSSSSWHLARFSPNWQTDTFVSQGWRRTRIHLTSSKIFFKGLFFFFFFCRDIRNSLDELLRDVYRYYKFTVDTIGGFSSVLSGI